RGRPDPPLPRRTGVRLPPRRGAAGLRRWACAHLVNGTPRGSRSASRRGNTVAWWPRGSPTRRTTRFQPPVAVHGQTLRHVGALRRRHLGEGHLSEMSWAPLRPTVLRGV